MVGPGQAAQGVRGPAVAGRRALVPTPLTTRTPEARQGLHQGRKQGQQGGGRHPMRLSTSSPDGQGDSHMVGLRLPRVGHHPQRESGAVIMGLQACSEHFRSSDKLQAWPTCQAEPRVPLGFEASQPCAAPAGEPEGAQARCQGQSAAQRQSHSTAQSRLEEASRRSERSRIASGEGLPSTAPSRAAPHGCPPRPTCRSSP